MAVIGAPHTGAKCTPYVDGGRGWGGGVVRGAEMSQVVYIIHLGQMWIWGYLVGSNPVMLLKSGIWLAVD